MNKIPHEAFSDILANCSINDGTTKWTFLFITVPFAMKENWLGTVSTF